MTRSYRSANTFALAGCVALFAWGGASFGQSSGDDDSARPRRPTPGNIRPLPRPEPTPMPPSGPNRPLPGRPARPPARDPAPSNPPPGTGAGVDTRGSGVPAPNYDDSDGDGQRDRGGYPAPDRGPDDDDRDRDRDRSRDRYRRPAYYYDDWRYDRYRGYDDGYRGYDPVPPAPVAPEPTDPPGGADAPGLLPPDDLMNDDDLPAALRKALEASPQYREATAQLLRAWADYARAAEQVLQRLRPNAKYQRALADLRQAESKVAAIRDRGGNVPAVNLVSAAQEAMLARRAVRAVEEQAIDADPVARRAKQQVDEAVERRNKIREDIAAKLPQARDAQPAE